MNTNENKKVYVRPEFTVIEVEQPQILASSDPKDPTGEIDPWG